MPGITNVLNRTVSLTTSPSFAPFTGVRLWYDDEHAFFSGDETGRVLEADCPWATQDIADSVLASVSGFVYQPFEAQTALLAPEAELGDGVKVGDTYSVLANINTTFDAMCASDISAPNDEELDHEYPYLTKQQREMARKVTLGADYYGTRITRKNGIEVVTTGADGTEKARVVLNSDVLAFYNDNGEEALYFDAEAGKYRFQGDVNITGGRLNINDNFIVTEDGSVYINGNINLSGGAITWGNNNPAAEIEPGLSESEVESKISSAMGELSLSVSNGEDYSSISLTLDGVALSSKTIQFTGDVVFASDLEGGTTTVSGDCITTGTLRAENIKMAGWLRVYDSDEGELVGRFGYITGTDYEGNETVGVGMRTTTRRMIVATDAGVKMCTADGQVVVTENINVETDGNLWLTGTNIYSNTSISNVSDRRKKDSIQYDMDKYIPIFDALAPATFYYTEHDCGKRHLGFIAQDVEEALLNAGVAHDDFAPLDIREDGFYGLRYEEFIPLLVAKVQQMDAELRALKNT